MQYLYSVMVETEPILAKTGYETETPDRMPLFVGHSFTARKQLLLNKMKISYRHKDMMNKKQTVSRDQPGTK